MIDYSFSLYAVNTEQTINTGAGKRLTDVLILTVHEVHGGVHSLFSPRGSVHKNKWNDRLTRFTCPTWTLWAHQRGRRDECKPFRCTGLDFDC